MGKRIDKIGLWMIGAGGGVGATVALGLAALRLRRVESTGLVTALPPFEQVGLVSPAQLVVGGHDIRKETLLSAVRGLHRRANVIESALIDRCAPALRAMQRNIRPGTLAGSADPIRALADDSMSVNDRTPAEAVERLADDMRTFRDRHGLARVVVVNLASCERPFKPVRATRSFESLTKALNRRGPSALPPSSLYALAAIEAGCAYINFTPSTGIDVPTLRDRAEQLAAPYMGRDGKTGETLVKSVLAPMFAMRNLAVRAWVGQNILGNRDGSVLEDAGTRTSKIRSKDRVVTNIVGGDPKTFVSIDYVPSLDDWKVAWDFVHFEGFLSTKMSMQFTWHGCDSLLAAPLVIDLTRLAELELRHHRTGPMRHLAFFFKDPTDVNRHDLPTQWSMLIDHVTKHTPGARRR